ncbi:MAG: acetyl-CoA carboxylase carboxyltransferase subunit alpha [Phycisphaerales bacterium]|nr:MAG: acetyl-CoA carboxylase carboxyltransferase subunit alpha [Phycisphaerales bacterium]
MSSEPVIATGSATSTGSVGFLEFEKPLVRIQHDIEEMEREQREGRDDLTTEIKQQRSRLRSTTRRLYRNLTPWEAVLVARHPDRPLSTDYLKLIFQDFCELHGDRAFGDDKAVMTGFARIGGHRVLFVGHNKGKDVTERIACNFGCAHPEGYRKALLKMRLAEKYGLPIVSLIDTQGAYPGIGAEERGIAQAIAVNLMEMSKLRTPIVCVVIGEGGSGGALGIAVGDRVAMFQHAFYSVISPEGCAAILWKTADQRKHAAEALKLTAPDLRKLDLIDEIIPEPLGGAHRDPERAAASLEKYIVGSLNELKRRTIDTLLRKRYDHIRHLGAFFDDPSEAKPGKASAKAPAVRRAASRSIRLASRVPRAEEVPA